jgi:uncharacterized protein (DUF952 family)
VNLTVPIVFCIYRQQCKLRGTLSRFFGNANKFFILRIEYRNVEKDTKWRDRNGGKYFDINTVTQLFTTFVYNPMRCEGKDMHFHIYNGLRLGKVEIESVVEWEKTSNGQWDSHWICKQNFHP